MKRYIFVLISIICFGFVNCGGLNIHSLPEGVARFTFLKPNVIGDGTPPGPPDYSLKFSLYENQGAEAILKKNENLDEFGNTNEENKRKFPFYIGNFQFNTALEDYSYKNYRFPNEEDQEYFYQVDDEKTFVYKVFDGAIQPYIINFTDSDFTQSDLIKEEQIAVRSKEKVTISNDIRIKSSSVFEIIVNIDNIPDPLYSHKVYTFEVTRDINGIVTGSSISESMIAKSFTNNINIVFLANAFSYEYGEESSLYRNKVQTALIGDPNYGGVFALTDKDSPIFSNYLDKTNFIRIDSLTETSGYQNLLGDGFLGILTYDFPALWQIKDTINNTDIHDENNRKLSYEDIDVFVIITNGIRPSIGTTGQEISDRTGVIHNKRNGEYSRVIIIGDTGPNTEPLKSIAHEMGHTIAGLKDEYCDVIMPLDEFNSEAHYNNQQRPRNVFKKDDIDIIINKFDELGAPFVSSGYPTGSGEEIFKLFFAKWEFLAGSIDDIFTNLTLSSSDVFDDLSILYELYVYGHTYIGMFVGALYENNNYNYTRTTNSSLMGGRAVTGSDPELKRINPIGGYRLSRSYLKRLNIINSYDDYSVSVFVNQYPITLDWGGKP